MAVKYYIRYFDIIGVEHRLDIYDDTYDDEAIQVDGKVTLTYSETDDVLESIRGQGLSVELEANQEMTFNDLWSEDEKTYKVEYYRDFVLKFQGWLNPEGWFENWVESNWMVTFDCVDGLGYLQDLSFVDENGFQFTGRKSYIEILYLALKRTGLDLPINVSIGIEYNGMDSSKNVLTQVYANTERYIKDDGGDTGSGTIMSCDEVIRDILEPFTAILTSKDGQWYICKPNELYSNTEVVFNTFRYFANNGILQSAVSKVLSTALNIGIDKYRDVFHCNSNQSIRNVSSIGAYRINYKYGVVKSYIENSNLYSDDGISLSGWSILSNTNLNISYGNGVLFNNVVGGSVSNLRTDPFLIGQYEKVNVYIEYTPYLVSFDSVINFNYRVIVSSKVITDPTADVYYLQDDLSWGDAGVENVLTSATAGLSATNLRSLDVSTPIIPSDISVEGYFYVVIDTPTQTPPLLGTTSLSYVSVKPIVDSTYTIEGEFHTLQRTTKPSAKVENVKEVSTGDNNTDRYLGAIYKADKVTPTESWNRVGISEAKPILQIMGEETLRLNAKAARVFSGDVFGYFDYLSVISLDGIDGVFMPISYSYDTKTNITSCQFKQIYGDELDDIDYNKTYDYGNTVKPTIRG